MSSYDVFWGIGDLFTLVLQPLDADWGITTVLNTGILILGFVGFLYWMNIQSKLNKVAENDSNQIK